MPLVTRKKYANGAKIAGYPLEIVKKIGSGGMAVVYEALDTELGLNRAVKVLDVGILGVGGKDPVEELRREARIMAKLHQRCPENIVQVLFVGQTKDSAGSLFIVMERLVGCSLKEFLSAKGAVEWKVGKQVVQHVAEALAIAHEEGLVHRDVKPANVYCDAPQHRRATRFVLLDFGIAALSNSSTNRFKGTFKYAAPEQMASPAVLTPRTDIYSLGVMFYEMLAGRHPFAECMSDAEMVRAHRSKVPPRLSTFAPGAPPELEALLSSMMAKEPKDRPDGMRVVVDVINSIHWDDRRNLEAPSDADTTVEELGTAVQHVEEAHGVARAVPLPFAKTDPVEVVAPEKQPEPPKVRVEHSTLESRVDHQAKVPPAAASVQIEATRLPVTPRLDPAVLAQQSPMPAPIVTRPRKQRLPETTEPMFDAPPLPPDVVAAREFRKQQPSRTEEPIEVPLRRIPSRNLLVAAFALGALLLFVGFLFRGALSERASAAAAAPSVSSPVAVPPVVTQEPSSASTATPAPMDSSIVATTAAIAPLATVTAAPSASAASTRPSTAPKVPSAPTKPQPVPPASTQVDPDVALFRNRGDLNRSDITPAASGSAAHRLPGSGL